MEPGIAELRRIAQRRTTVLYDTLFTRRVSIYVTWLLHRLGVTPNAVSACNLVVGLAACAVLGAAHGAWVLAGAGLIHLYAVLDSVDGELARLTKRTSLEGLFLEDLSAYVVTNAFWLAMGAYLHRTTGLLWPAGVAIALCALFHNAMPAARRALLNAIHGRRPVDPAGIDLGEGAGRGALGRLRAFVEEHVLHGANVWALLSTLVVVEELAGVGDLRLVLWTFTVIAAGHVARELGGVAMLLRGRALERELLRIRRSAAGVAEQGHGPDAPQGEGGGDGAAGQE